LPISTPLSIFIRREKLYVKTDNRSFNIIIS
jgi:hypothetical protein